MTVLFPVNMTGNVPYLSSIKASALSAWEGVYIQDEKNDHRRFGVAYDTCRVCEIDAGMPIRGGYVHGRSR